MGLFSFLNKKQVEIERSVKTNTDGSTTHTTSFEVPSESRPVRTDVVTALDAALGALGSKVMHAMDPTRMIPFELGGPPVWSVGIVDVAGPRPYSLLVTYGFSHVLSPEPMREGMNHEYSLAIPQGTPLSPWADALLRHQTRYILGQGADIRPNDCVPLRGVPMTRVPFQPQHHAMMPDSTLVGIMCTPDPVLPTVATPHGPIEVRRLFGVDVLELDRAETWSIEGFIDELKTVNPLFLSDIARRSFMADPAFAARLDARAAKEGSDVDGALFDFAWRPSATGVTLQLPEGRAATRFASAIAGRVGFGRRLAAFSMKAPPLLFDPATPEGLKVTQQGVTIGGGKGSRVVEALTQALAAKRSSVELG